MEILNIGPLELIIILLIAFILLGPKDMIITAQRVGRWIRNFVRSPMWKEILGYSQDIRELPKMIMDETGLQETLAEVTRSTKEVADELNAQVKEATEAARVPEVEHLTIHPNAIVDGPPTAPSISAPVPYKGTEAETAAAEPGSPVEAGTEGVVNAAEPDAIQPDYETANAAYAAAPAAAEPEAKLDVSVSSTNEEPGASPAALDVAATAAVEPQKKTRKRKTVTGEGGAVGEQNAVGADAQPKKPRKRKAPQTDQAVGTESAGVMVFPVEETPAASNGNGAAQEHGLDHASSPAEVPSTIEAPAETTAKPARRPRRPRTPDIQAAEGTTGEHFGSNNGGEPRNTTNQPAITDPEEQTQNADAA